MPNPSPYSGHQFRVNDRNDAWSNLFALVPDGSRVLDVGCSTGNFALALEERKGCRSVGIDISEGDVRIARESGLDARVVDFTRDDLSDLGRFDVIVCADVLEHVADPRAGLRGLAQLLVPGGKVVYSIPNMAHISIRMQLMAGDFPYTKTGLLDATHLRFWDHEEVDNVFADAGFSIDVEYAVIVDYPREYVTELLEGLHLRADEGYWNTLESTHAFTYQFVGAAAVRADNEPPLEPTLRTRLQADRVVRQLAQAANERTAAAQQQLSATRTELRQLRRFVDELRRRPIRTAASSLVRTVRRRFGRSKPSAEHSSAQG